MNLLDWPDDEQSGLENEVAAMFEVFTALFTILFTLFVGAAIAGHVLLAQALIRVVRGERRGPSRQAAAADRVPAGVAVTGR